MGPWEKYAAPAPQGAPQGVLGTIPGRTDPYKAEDQQMQREANARAAAAADRAATAAERSANADERTAVSGDLNNQVKLRSDYQNLPQIKTYNEFLPALFKAVEAPDNAQGDLAILYAFSKSMDPTTGVREGEQAMARDTASLAGQAQVWAKRVQEGNRLPPEVRQNFVEVMRRTGKQYARSYEQQRDYFAKVAERAGYDPFDVVGPHAYEPFAEAEKAYITERGGVPKINGVPIEGEGGGKRLTPEQEQELLTILRRDGGEAANAYLKRSGLEFQDTEEAEKNKAGVIDYADSERMKKVKPAGVTDLVVHGATLGLSDEASGVGNALANIIMSPFTGNFNPVNAYQQGNAEQDRALALGREKMGWAGTALEIGGGLASGNVSNALAIAPNLLGRIGQGARAGAAGGGIAGFGYGEGPSSVLTAGAGAIGGAAVGAALPVAGQVIGNRVDGLRRLTGRDPGLPRRVVGEAMEADGLTPAAAGQMMDEAGQRGSPMMLADTGENARGLLASVGRQPGSSRSIARDAVINRQNAQAERISDAVVRDLGPTANIREMGDSLIEQARTAAAPLYEKAYSNSGASLVKLDDLATRPAFVKALRNAIDIALEEGVDPTALGIRLDDVGEVIIDRTPSWQTLDYIKRGLDDVVEGFRDSTTGKLNLTSNTARATNSTLRTLVARMDKVNGDYAAARAAYAGPAKMREALEKGAKSLSKSPDDIMAMMKGMGDSEQEAFRMGVRKSITDMLGSVKDGGDKVARLLGTPKSRAVLTRVFGGRGNFERFIQTLQDEEVMGRTYRSVTGNSATAERLAQDAQTQDAGLVEAATQSAIRGARTGSLTGGMIGDALEALQNVGRFGAGKAGERTRESVAALLTETDPAVLRELIRAANKAAADQRRLTGRRGRRAVSQGRNVGNLSGLAAGQLSPEPR